MRIALVAAAFACATLAGTIGFAQSTITIPAAEQPAESPQAAPPDQTPAAQAPAADATQAAPAAQSPAPQPADTQAAEPAKSPDTDAARPADHEPAPTAAEIKEMAVAEEQLKQQLEGKTFYLRGSYLDNNLHFNEKGELDGSSPKASYTLSLVQIDRVKVEKHHVELEGVRYGIHFLGALATDDQSANVDRVKLTSKKKPLKITIDREIVVAPKKEKAPKPDKKKTNEKKPAVQVAASAKPAAAATAAAQSAEPLPSAPTPSTPATEPTTEALPSTASTQPLQSATPVKPALKEAETTRHGVTVTTSQQEANRMLRTALDHIFSPGIDDRMVASLPDYWKYYYKASAEKADYKPTDPAVLKSNQVDKKPRLLMAFQPPSNEYAQNNGVAGMAMYHVVVGPDGKPQEVAIGRPIGFGLDENAVDAIRKASFEPGMKDGKAVPVEVDLTVQFRIYSKRTAAVSSEGVKVASPEGPKLPGPYSVNAPTINQPQ